MCRDVGASRNADGSELRRRDAGTDSQTFDTLHACNVFATRSDTASWSLLQFGETIFRANDKYPKVWPSIHVEKKTIRSCFMLHCRSRFFFFFFCINSYDLSCRCGDRYLESNLIGDYHVYLKHARNRIKSCTKATSSWTYPYDGDNPPQSCESNSYIFTIVFSMSFLVSLNELNCVILVLLCTRMIYDLTSGVGVLIESFQ